MIATSFGSKKDYVKWTWVKNPEGENVKVKLISENKDEEIKNKANLFLKKVKPNLFLNESSNIDMLLNP